MHKSKLSEILISSFIPLASVDKSTKNSIVNKIELKTLPPLSLYVHFPWCVRKCPYCDFNSHQIISSSQKNGYINGKIKISFPEDLYIDALLADLEKSLPLIWGRTIHTIFIGGGTPSLLSAAAIERLLSNFRALLPVAPDAEITLEANPGAIEAAKFADFRSSGINRLSLGIQSFNDKHLIALGRIHSGEQAKQAIKLAMKYFDNINLDLMFALPEQSLDEATKDVEIALSFATQHLSCYQLTLEPNTLFAKYKPKLPSHDLAFLMQIAIEEKIAKAHFEHYEVSAYAKYGYHCKHNLNYWNFGDYLGIGAGAHGKLSFSDHIIRQIKPKHPQLFIETMLSGTTMTNIENIAWHDLPFEFMLGSLRLKQAVKVSNFTARTGIPLNIISPKLDLAEKKGLLKYDGVHIQTTALGKNFLNDLQEIFLAN